MENLGVLRPVDVQILVHQLVLQTYRIINQLKWFEMFNYPNCFAVILSINHNLIPLVPFLNHNLAPLTAHGWANVVKLLSVKGLAGDINLSWGLRHLLDRLWSDKKSYVSCRAHFLSLQFDLSWWSWWNTWKPLRYTIFPPKKKHVTNCLLCCNFLVKSRRIWRTNWMRDVNWLKPTSSQALWVK